MLYWDDVSLIELSLSKSRYIIVNVSINVEISPIRDIAIKCASYDTDVTCSIPKTLSMCILHII